MILVTNGVDFQFLCRSARDYLKIGYLGVDWRPSTVWKCGEALRTFVPAVRFISGLAVGLVLNFRILSRNDKSQPIFKHDA